MKTETQSRSLLKTISWRVVATLTTAVLVLIFTGDLSIAIGVGGLEAVLKLLFYYLHERAWSHVGWGTYYRNKE